PRRGGGKRFAVALRGCGRLGGAIVLLGAAHARTHREPSPSACSAGRTAAPGAAVENDGEANAAFCRQRATAPYVAGSRCAHGPDRSRAAAARRCGGAARRRSPAPPSAADALHLPAESPALGS